MRGVVAMDERPKARQLGDDVRALRQSCYAVAPVRSALRREVFQHAGMLQDERHVRTSLGKTGCISHLLREHLEVEAPAVFGEPCDVAPDPWIRTKIRARGKAVKRVLVPVQLLAHPTHQRIFGKAIKLWTHI